MITDGEVKAIVPRGLTEATCAKWGYEIGKDPKTGEVVHIANYRGRDGGRVVAQKLRFANKDFRFDGSPKEVGLYGQWLWAEKGKRIVITEGEIDALSVSQVQNNKWPVVSVPNGAQGAHKTIAKEVEWLSTFGEIILMFDDDEPGREGVAKCAPLLPAGKVKIATIAGYKDANEAVQACDSNAVMNAIYEAKEYRPDGIISISNIRDAVLKPVEWGLDWPWETLTQYTYGRRRGEVYLFGAGTGIGKTDVFTQIIAHVTEKEDNPAGVFYFEQHVVETGKRIAGKLAGKRFHIPDAGWTQEELVSTLDKMCVRDNVYLYDGFGSTDWDVIKGHVRFLAHSKGVKDLFIDHLTALADPANERESLEVLMKEVAMLAQELQVTIYMISHLATPEGKPHEEGGRVMIRHFKGSRSIGFWSYFMFGLERDQQHQDENIRKTTTLRVLKDRYTGQSAGKKVFLGYDEDTGILNEVEEPTPASDYGFDDETGSDEQPF